MIKLIDKQKIIIMHLNEGKSQRRISRELGIDRKTIRRYLMEYNKIFLPQSIENSSKDRFKICQTK